MITITATITITPDQATQLDINPSTPHDTSRATVLLMRYPLSMLLNEGAEIGLTITNTDNGDAYNVPSDDNDCCV